MPNDGSTEGGTTTPPTGRPSEDGAETGPNLLAGIGGHHCLIEKTLVSDFSEEEQWNLLKDAQNFSTLFVEFDDAHLNELLGVMSIFSLTPGTTVVHKGQDATFLCIVLKGSLEIQLPKTVAKTGMKIEQGAIIGEMAYYEAGKRSCDVVAATEVTLGLITYDGTRKEKGLDWWWWWW